MNKSKSKIQEQEITYKNFIYIPISIILHISIFLLIFQYFNLIISLGFIFTYIILWSLILFKILFIDDKKEKLKWSLYYFDIETKGTDPIRDEIITIQYQKIDYKGNKLDKISNIKNKRL